MKYKIVCALFFVSIAVFAQSWEDPLFTALERKSLEEIKELVAQGTDVNKQDYAGRFPLEYAIRCRCGVEILQYLIDQGANINPKIDSVSSLPPLLRAVDMDDASLETIKFLVKHGADITAIDHNGYTILMLAADHSGNAPIIEFLIQVRADIQAKEKNGQTALHFAANRQESDVIKLLVQAGADINAQTKDGDTPLMKSIDTPASEHNTAETLIKLGAKVNLQNQKGMTALMYACKQNRYVDTIQLLLDYKANLALEDVTGRTALDYFDLNKNKFVRENPIRKRLKKAI